MNLYGDRMRLVNELDINNTGNVSIREFERILCHDASNEKWMYGFTYDLRSMLKADPRATFDSFDTNGSNYLTADQFKQALMRLNPSMNPLDANR